MLRSSGDNSNGGANPERAMTAYTESVLSPLGSSSRAAAEATVLVIDDDPAMRDILNVLAQQHGFALQFAHGFRQH
jgi:hypothetical protein